MVVEEVTPGDVTVHRPPVTSSYSAWVTGPLEWPTCVEGLVPQGLRLVVQDRSTGPQSHLASWAGEGAYDELHLVTAVQRYPVHTLMVTVQTHAQVTEG